MENIFEGLVTKRDERNLARGMYHKIWALKELREIYVAIDRDTAEIDRITTSLLDGIAFLREV